MYFRLCVDVDQVGNVIGGSYEEHGPDGVTTVFVLPPGSPFDRAHHTLTRLYDAVLRDTGFQLELFPSRERRSDPVS